MRWLDSLTVAKQTDVQTQLFQYSRIRLYHPPPDRTKVADRSGWMIKPVGPNSSSKCQLHIVKKKPNPMMSSCSAALHWLVPRFKSWSLSRITTFFLSMSNLSVSLEPSCTNETQNVSQAATPAIRAICAALSEQMFPLAPLKVADTTGGLDDISREFYCVKIRFRPTNGQYKRLDDTFVDDITGFYCIKKGRGMQDRSEPLKWERYLPVRGRRATWCHSRAQTRSAARRKSASEPPSLTFRSAAVW